MKKIIRPELADAVKLSPMEMNNLHFHRKDKLSPAKPKPPVK